MSKFRPAPISGDCFGNILNEHGALNVSPWSKAFYSHPGQGFRQVLAVVLLIGIGLELGGCSFLPNDGPSSARIHSEASSTYPATPPKSGSKQEPYQIITVNSQVVKALKNDDAQRSDSGLSSLATPLAKDIKVEKMFRVTGMAGLALPPRQTIAEGDSLNITIYESGGGLFGPLVPGAAQGSSSGVLPTQTVDESGQITVPFAGQIQVLGRTTFEVEQEIVSRLKAKSINPQAIVTVAGRKGGDLVTVTGDVKLPSMVPVPLGGLRLLDAITISGGATGTAYESNVTVVRGTEARSELMADVLSDVNKNISLQPRDTVIVRNRPWHYLAFGASGKTGEFSFGNPDLSMAEAMANSGGAADDQAEPIIYVYRLESTQAVRAMGASTVASTGQTTPVIYQLDLRTPQGYFLAQRFPVRDKDVLYFSDATSVGVLKFFGIVNALTAPARTGLTGGKAIQGY